MRTVATVSDSSLTLGKLTHWGFFLDKGYNSGLELMLQSSFPHETDYALIVKHLQYLPVSFSSTSILCFLNYFSTVQAHNTAQFLGRVFFGDIFESGKVEVINTWWYKNIQLQSRQL